MHGRRVDALGEDVFVDDEGVKHDWRAELRAELAGRQRDDGSWVNSDTRWMEGDVTLVTSYGLLTLAYCKPQSKTTEPDQ